MKRTTVTLNSEFYCTKCANRGIPIVRTRTHEREGGHLKRLYCLHCKEEVNMVECKPFTKYDYNDFIFEYKHNNFDEYGNRKMSYGELKQKIQKEDKEKRLKGELINE